MIHCFTSSYDKDLQRVLLLNNRLIKHELTHHIFVEQKDIELFKQNFNNTPKTLIHLKPDNGGGGLGRDGTMCRFACYKVLESYIKEHDTFVQLDSDVIIELDLIPQLECEPNEIKGFYNKDYPVHLERSPTAKPTDVRFIHLSGMSICAYGQVFLSKIPKDSTAMWDIITHMLEQGFTPSEDVMLSYLLYSPTVKVTNLFDICDRAFNAKGDAYVFKKSGDFGTTLFR